MQLFNLLLIWKFLVLFPTHCFPFQDEVFKIYLVKWFQTGFVRIRFHQKVKSKYQPRTHEYHALRIMVGCGEDKRHMGERKNPSTKTPLVHK